MVHRSRFKSARKAALAGARVLVVDDHSITVGMLKDALYAGGAASVQSAPDGEAAIAMLNGFAPHLLVTDWRMPGMSGLGLTRAIRQGVLRPDPRIANPRMPIVLVSAHASAKAVEAARRAGVDEVVVKPFSMTSLLKRIAAAANKPRASWSMTPTSDPTAVAGVATTGVAAQTILPRSFRWRRRRSEPPRGADQVTT